MVVHIPLDLVITFLSEIASPLKQDARSTNAERWDAKRLLTKCALVSRDWRALAQPYQFQDLTVYPIVGAIRLSIFRTPCATNRAK